MLHIELLSDVLELFRIEQGRYLSTDEGLDSLTQERWSYTGDEKNSYLRRLPLDPWGNPYHYRYPGIHSSSDFELWSYGADGVAGGEGVNADCGNWHNGDCYQPPVKKTKLLVFVVLGFTNPALWCAFYIGHTLLRKKRGANLKTAMRGWHLKILLFSFPTFLILMVSTSSFLMGC